VTKNIVQTNVREDVF